VAITFENGNYSTASATTTTGLTYVFVNLRFGSVPDRFLVVAVTTRSNTNVATSVIWQPQGSATGQQSLSLIQRVTHGSQNLCTELWGLVAPTVTTPTTVTSRVGVTWGVAGTQTFVGAAAFAGVDQTTPYPGYPAAFSGSSDQSASPLVGSTTATLAVSTVAGNLVLAAIAKDNNTVTDRLIVASGTGIKPRVMRMSAGTAVSSVEGCLGTLRATGATTNLSWSFLQGGGSPQTGRSYVQLGVPLNQSTSVAPYVIDMPSCEVRTNGAPFSGGGFPTSNNAAFPTVGSVTISARPQNTVSNRVAMYSATTTGTNSTFTIGFGGSGTASIGEPVEMIMNDFYNADGTTAIARIPSTAAVDDVAVVAVYSEEETFDIQPAVGGAFTEIQTSDGAVVGSEFRFRTFYRRLIGGDPGTSFTFNVGAGATYRYLSGAIYRGCVTSGSPIGATTAAPTSNTGSSAAPTATGITTTQADMTVIMAQAMFNDRTTTAPATLDERVETARNIWLADSAVLTASATGNQVSTISSTSPWAAQLFALVPAVGGATLPFSAVRATTAFTSSASRQGTYLRSASRTTSAFASVASRLATYRRTAARTTASFVSAATRSVILRRTASRATSAFTSAARRRGTFLRNAVRASGPILAFATWRGVLFRSAVRATTVRTAAAQRKGNPFRRAALRTTSAFTATARRRGIFRRSSSRTTITISLVASRRYTAKRNSLRQTIGGGVYTAHMTVQGVGITFSPFSLLSGFSNIPILRLIDSTDYLNPTFYFEANIQSSSSVLPAYARLWDVTAGGPVTGSQITTSASHAVAQRVRSGSIPIISGHVYRAELGKASGHNTAMASADVIVEVLT
jgi:hypothetical protein